MEITLEENKKRNDKLHAYYNPITGEGSLLDRFPLHFNNNSVIYLPNSMREKWEIKGNLEDKKNFPELAEQIHHERLDHDFEFWAFVCVKIKPKEGGDPIPFKLNGPQRKLLKELEAMRINNLPIRAIIVKARQWGGSTMIQIYMAWIQTRHKTNWNSLIAAHINQAATNIRFMYSTLQKYYPKEIDDFTLKAFEGTTNIKFIPERSNKITIGSMQTPDSIRSDDVSMCHLSEVGLWKKTEGKSPEDMAQSILGTIPSVPYSVYILESTGKGSGNYFHRAWKRAVSKESNLVPVFVSWFEIPQYQMPFNDDKERQEFISTLSEYELYLWDIGATLEGIKWYRWKLKEYEGDTWRMQSEFPSTPNESFQSTGRRVYNPAYIQSLRIHERPPILMGDIFPSIHKENRGKKAFEDLVIKDTTNGALSVWRMPNDPPAPAGFTVTDRYAIAADIGGRTKDADYSTISVLDRYWMLEGGDPDFIMTWRGHIDQDIFAWKCAQLGWLLDQGLLAIEVNSLRKQKDTEGEHFHTVLDEIAEYYPNLFMRNNPEQAREGTPNRYGFHTNVQSKGMIIDNFNQSARDETFIDYDERANDEADYYEVKEDGTVGAVDGQHDDIHMGRAIALWLGQKYMEPPKLVPIKKGTARGKNVKTSVFL